MPAPRVTLALSLAVVSLLAAACGASSRPRDLTAWQVVGDGAQASCRAAGPGEPLVVDWEAHERGNLEEAMHDGVAVVAYDCKTLRLLKGCSVDSAYGFLAFSKKEQTVRFENADEVSANMPAFGIPLLHDLSGELKQDSTLDLTMILVGKKRTTVREAGAEKLLGGNACDGATHFVRGAFVGAFALGTGTRGSASVGLGVFSAGSHSAKLAKYRDGEPETCTQVKPESPAAPDTCDALIRLELVALGAAKGLRGPPPEGGRPGVESLDKLKEETAALEGGCPSGLFLIEGKCAPASDTRPHQCERDVADCVRQCDRGHRGSCANLGYLYVRGEGVSKDLDKGIRLTAEACQAGIAVACANLGAFYESGQGVPRDDLKAVAFYARSCDAGEPTGCYNLGVKLKDGSGVPQDLGRALSLFAQSCEGGEGAGCANLGMMYMSGMGAPRDEPRAARLFKRACDGGIVFGCFNLGYAYAHGLGVPTDLDRARSLYEQSCDAGNGLGCTNLGMMSRSGTGAPRDDARALGYFTRSCDLGEMIGCLNLGVLYANGFGVTRDEPRAVALYRRACDAKVAGGCAYLGLMMETGRGVPANRGEAVRLYRLGCELGNAEGCEQLKRLGE